MAEISAWDGIMREKMPTNSSTLTTITMASGTWPRLVQIATITTVSSVPKQKVLNLPKLSLALPDQRPARRRCKAR